MHRIVDKLSCALFDSDLISTRLTLAMAEMLWCFMLLCPGDTFTRPTYDVMSNIAGETWWAAFFGISSILQFAVVLRNELQSNWARVFAMWNASLWIACRNRRRNSIDGRCAVDLGATVDSRKRSSKECRMIKKKSPAKNFMNY